MGAHARPDSLRGADFPGKATDLRGFGHSEEQFAAILFIQVAEFLFHLVRQPHQFTGPVPQKQALLGEADVEGMAHEELLAQFVFQGFQRFGEGGLGHAQPLGGAGHVLVPGHRQKVAKRAQIHRLSCTGLAPLW